MYNYAQGYDVEGRLAYEARAGGSAAFTAGYRADGLRAWKGDGSGARTYYLYDEDGDPCVELSAAGAVTAVNAFAPDGLVGRKQGNAWTYYAFDPQGSAAQRLDAAGNVVSVSVYDAFGRASITGVWDDPFGYDARWGYCRDRESEYCLCRNRYYDPIGRWVTRDPIGYAAGINLYGYCGMGPVGSADPSGLSVWGWGDDQWTGLSRWWLGDTVNGPDGYPARIGGYSNALNPDGNIMTYNGTMHARNRRTYDRWRNDPHWVLHEEGHAHQGFTSCSFVPYFLGWQAGIFQELVTGTGEPSGGSGNPYGHDYNPYETGAEDYARQRDGQWRLKSSPHSSVRPTEEWAPWAPWVPNQ